MVWESVFSRPSLFGVALVDAQLPVSVCLSLGGFWVSGPLLLILKTTLLPCPEKDRAKHGPDLLVSPMFAEDVSRVNHTKDVNKLRHLQCDSLPNMMVAQGKMPFLEDQVWDCCTCHHRLIVPKEVGLALDGYS